MVFHPDTVEDYVAMRVRAGADPRVDGHRSSRPPLDLEDRCPTLLSRKRVKIAKPDPETPYGAAEIDSLLASSGLPRRRSGAATAVRSSPSDWP